VFIFYYFSIHYTRLRLEKTCGQIGDAVDVEKHVAHTWWNFCSSLPHISELILFAMGNSARQRRNAHL